MLLFTPLSRCLLSRKAAVHTFSTQLWNLLPKFSRLIPLRKAAVWKAGLNKFGDLGWRVSSNKFTILASNPPGPCPQLWPGPCFQYIPLETHLLTLPFSSSLGTKPIIISMDLILVLSQTEAHLFSLNYETKQIRKTGKRKILCSVMILFLLWHVGIKSIKIHSAWHTLCYPSEA